MRSVYFDLKNDMIKIPEPKVRANEEYSDDDCLICVRCWGCVSSVEVLAEEE